ncbi:MAG: cytochrome C oxidase subunit IV family protein [Microscillaceae bacterium]|nr:cytochrome C oxidase subunit IV family protein [Microscillaceae bacterium]
MADVQPISNANTPQEIAKPNTAIIWKTFWILLGLTVLEFIIAFTLPANTFRVGIFVILTIAKAAYIVGEFMHLRHEVKFLIWTILLPMIFVVWLLIALIAEGASIFFA